MSFASTATRSSTDCRLPRAGSRPAGDGETTPGEIRAASPEHPPESPKPGKLIFSATWMASLTPASPVVASAVLRLLPIEPQLSSVLGDYVSTGMGVLGLAWQSSPALTEVEEAVTDWLRQMIGLSRRWSGVIQDTASTSTLIALVCARERVYQLRPGAAAASRAETRSRSSSTPRRRATARWRRRRCSPASAGRERHRVAEPLVGDLVDDEQLARQGGVDRPGLRLERVGEVGDLVDDPAVGR